MGLVGGTDPGRPEGFPLWQGAGGCAPSYQKISEGGRVGQPKIAPQPPPPPRFTRAARTGTLELQPLYEVMP